VRPPSDSCGSSRNSKSFRRATRLSKKSKIAREWRYLVGEYPEGTQSAISHPDRLIARLKSLGVTPKRLDPASEALLDELASPEFDVLHILCHGETELDDIERARLILGDGASRPASSFDIDATTVRGEAHLEDRTPLIFLSTCESGQQGFSLTDQGGWPQAFISAGAGSFVGTSWSVREQPANEFAIAFYDALLGGMPLYTAANAGRAAAKAKPDASWLAFVVYGRPTAKMQSL
jgi:CHAT domain